MRESIICFGFKKKRLMPGELRSINLLEGLIKMTENRYN